VGAPNVVGLAEIAQRLGIGKSYARELALRKGFPDATRLSMGLVWDADEVDAWIKANRPKLAEAPEGE
jgi:predicted DNA-binding transcriptional regulator AlpA